MRLAVRGARNTASQDFHHRRSGLLGIVLALVFSVSVSGVRAQKMSVGGSIRGYQFLRLDDPLVLRRDSEIALLRLTSIGTVHSSIHFEVHGLLRLNSPQQSGGEGLTLTRSRFFLPLEGDLTDTTRADLLASFDRLNVAFDFDRFRVKVGRQAISWGNSFFWPAADLFTPFSPQQIDRDYKSGVDAVRITVPMGVLSELEIIGAVLGSSTNRDGAAAGRFRFNVAGTDLTFFGGRFHRDEVLGGYFTSSFSGLILRGELAWTNSGDSLDRPRGREDFVRASLGVDRQVTSALGLSLELSFNGYGAGDPRRYLEFLTADRIQRGEVNALGRFYSGSSLTYQVHPLLNWANSVLINWSDRSVLWVPAATWSTGDNSDVVFGAQIGLGDDLGPDLAPRSEYGAAGSTVFVGARLYF